MESCCKGSPNIVQHRTINPRLCRADPSDTLSVRRLQPYRSIFQPSLQARRRFGSSISRDLSQAWSLGSSLAIRLGVGHRRMSMSGSRSSPRDFQELHWFLVICQVGDRHRGGYACSRRCSSWVRARSASFSCRAASRRSRRAAASAALSRSRACGGQTETWINIPVVDGSLHQMHPLRRVPYHRSYSKLAKARKD